MGPMIASSRLRHSVIRAGPAGYAWPGERAEVIVLCVAYQGGLPGLAGRRSRAPPRSS